MKKMLMMVVMVLTLAFSSICSASNGSVLDAQEKIASNFLNSSNFKSVAAVMTDDMKQHWDEKAYANFKNFMAEKYGKINENRLILVEKRLDGDVLLYQIASEKIPAARLLFVFKVEKEKTQLAFFDMILPQPKEEAPAAEQK